MARALTDQAQTALACGTVHTGECAHSARHGVDRTVIDRTRPSQFDEQGKPVGDS